MNNKENLMRMLHRQNPEWVPVWKDSVKFQPCNALEDRCNQGTGKDWFGVPWVDFMPFPPADFLPELSDWKNVIKFPDLDAIDWEGWAARDLEGFNRDEKVLWIPLFCGIFERVHGFTGFENALMAFYEEPEAFKELIEALTDFKLKEIDKVVQYYKPDVICMHDDYGMKKSMLMSPETWREFLKEPLKRINDHVTELGCTFVLHCCGKIDPIVGDFVEIGITAWDSVNFCNDLETLYAKYGKQLSFTTNLNMWFLAEANEEETREHVRDAIDMLGKYGNMAPRDDGPTMTPETLSWITDEARKYGADYYKQHPIPPID